MEPKHSSRVVEPFFSNHIYLTSKITASRWQKRQYCFRNFDSCYCTKIVALYMFSTQYSLRYFPGVVELEFSFYVYIFAKETC